MQSLKKRTYELLVWQVWLKKKRIKYVGHDVTEDRNCYAQSKFYPIDYCKLPKNGQVLFSFIRLVNFYHRYSQ